MPATIVLLACTGTNAATETEVTGITMRANDSAVNDTANPIVIPSASLNRSYEKWLRWKCTGAPSNQVTNFKYWGPGSVPATGTILYDGTTASGATPVASDSATAVTQQDTNHYSSGTALTVGGTLININDKSNFLVLQLDVASTASPGSISQQTHNYSYDET